MKFPSIFPKDDKFYKLIEELSAEACTSVRHLKIFISQNGVVRTQAGEDIAASKARAKACSAAITSELCRSFITPFDREDIQDLANILYKIPKTTKKIKERLVLHRLGSDYEDFHAQVDLIVQEADASEKMIQALIKSPSNRKILEYASVVDDLEHQADAVRNQLLADLFKSDEDVRDIIVRRDIYDMLEKVVDRFRDVAGVAIQIVLKHT